MRVSFKDIESLIRLFERSNWNELRVETTDLQLVISDDAAARPLTGAPTAKISMTPAPKTSTTAAMPTALSQDETHADTAMETDGMLVIRAPNLGTFYRAPKPGAPPYIEIGQEVSPDMDVCLIEVMKLFTSVKAGVSGRIVRICVGDGVMIEHDEPLFYVEPTVEAAQAAE